jgi:hypothetical protein
MHKHVYNGSILLGVLLVSTGAGLVYLPAGLITGGLLVLGLTLASARLANGARR